MKVVNAKNGQTTKKTLLPEHRNNKIKFFYRTIQALLEANRLLNQTLIDQGVPPVSPNSRSASQLNNHCLTNACYTPTEFALYGVCIGIAGIFIAVFVVSKFLLSNLTIFIEVKF